MKIFKIIGFVLMAILAVILIVAAFLPSNYYVERSVVINRPAEDVYNQVVNLRQWEIWSPWLGMEPDAKLSYSEPDSGSGAYYSWEGEKIGKGQLTILNAVKPDSLRGKLEFFEPFPSEAINVFYFQENEAGTKVTWAMQGELDYPMGRFFGLSLEGTIGPDFEKGLKKLKEYTESQPQKIEEMNESME